MKRIILILVLIFPLWAKDYLLTWNANTEADLAGYIWYINGHNSYISDKQDTSLLFWHPYWQDIQVYGKAFDTSGNLSESSDTLVVEISDSVKCNFNDSMSGVDIFDMLLFNKAWTEFITDDIYDPRYDIFPRGFPDSTIDINDKLIFNKTWKEQ